MTEQELTPIQKRRKEILDRCEVASRKMDEGDPNAAEELYQALKEFNDVCDEEEMNKCC